MELNEFVARLDSQDGKIEAAAKQIEALTQTVKLLEGQQIQMNSLMFVKDRVIDELSGQLHNLQQYSRRYSCIIKGIPKPPAETKESLKTEIVKIIDEVGCETTLNDIDKFHRNGPKFGNEQDVIVRFRTHQAKEVLYKNRKNQNDQNIKIQPSLTEYNRSLLSQARDLLEDEYDEPILPNPPDFVLANVHGQLQVKMTKKFKNQLFFQFTSLKQLHEIIDKCNTAYQRNEVDDYNNYLLPNAPVVPATPDIEVVEE